MMRGKISRRDERGATLVEFAIGALVFFSAVFGVLECGRLLWTHNALTDAVRRGARYAVINNGSESCTTCKDNVKNVVVYRDPAGGTTPVVSGLAPANVAVTYSADFGVKQGTVAVSITGYSFSFSIPLFNATLTMPSYKTTLTGESVGYAPSPIP